MLRLAAISVTFAGLLLQPWPGHAQHTALSAAEIMARVAANQDRSDQDRLHYVYRQHTRTVSRSGNTVRCEEIADFRVTPTADKTDKKLLHLDGRVLVKRHYLQYQEPTPAKPGTAKDSADKPDPVVINLGDSDDPMDRDLVENLTRNLTSAPSKDGIGAELFPLTSKSQQGMNFRLLGQELKNGLNTFHLSFQPRDKSDLAWKGDAWIDARSFQPVVVRTELSRKIPLAVRTLLGTNLPGLGFTIIYAPQKDGVWFPVSFGTEFKLDVLFFLRRQITLAVTNGDFERTHVSTRIIGADPAVDEPAVDDPASAKR